MFKQTTTTVEIPTRGRGLFEFTDQVRNFVGSAGIEQGLLTLFCRHTSASLLIQENADPDVCHDLQDFFAQLSPDGQPGWRHRSEGPDDMSAHIRCALTHTSLGIPVVKGRPVLGTWQGIHLWEHRTRPHCRQVLLHLVGE